MLVELLETENSCKVYALATAIKMRRHSETPTFMLKDNYSKS